MSGFWSSLFGGANSNLSNDVAATGQIAANQSGQGQKNQNSASSFWNGILSGDSSKISQSLAPAIDSAKTSAAQDIKTNALRNSRSGGTTAANASTQDKIHGYITNLIGSLTGQSASDLASLGTSQVSTGLSAYDQNAKLSQIQMQNWQNSILGKGITGGVQAAETAGLGAAGGALPGGPGAAAGAQGALAGWFSGGGFGS